MSLFIILLKFFIIFNRALFVNFYPFIRNFLKRNFFKVIEKADSRICKIA